MRSPSQGSVGLQERVGYAVRLLRLWIMRFLGSNDHTAVLASIAGAAYDYERLTGASFKEARVLDLGFGARPLRVRALHSMGVDAVGIDLDLPLLTVGDSLAVLRSSGLVRATKSVFRHLLFDRREYRLFDRRLRAAGLTPTLHRDRLLAGDASAVAFAPNSFDVIVSFDVLEHVRPESIEPLVANLERWLRPGGVAIMQPMVYTGIAGDHRPETYPYRVRDLSVPSSIRPWAHLDEAEAPRADTYLNRLSRSDYRDAFSSRLLIVDEHPVVPGLGYYYLSKATPSIRARYPIEELLSNGVRYVLVKRGD